MDNKKTYIFLMTIVIAFGIIMYFVFAKPNIKSGKDSATFIVGDNTIWKYDNKKWLNITLSSSIKKLNWQKYKVFSDNKFLGTYQLMYNDKWYAFTDKNKAVNLNGKIFAYKSNYNINLLQFESKEITPDDYVYQVLSNNNISLSSKLTSLSKTDIDFDNDGKLESFYIVSNAFADNFSPEYTFAFVFMVKDKQIYEIYKDISKNEFYNGCKPYFTSFLDINNDNIYEFILSCGKYSIEEEVNMLYQLDNDNFKILISN